MKSPKVVLLMGAISALLAAPLTAVFAGEGAGVRGGGHVVEVSGGRLELLDLVAGNSFDCQSGSEMLAAHAKIGEILRKVSALDWYFGAEVRHEIQFLRWCMTGPLYSVPAFSEDSFVRGLRTGVQQAAFRYNDAAYIDETKFARLTPRSQALLVIHEVMHSYLDMEDPLKMDHLRTIVNTISRIDSGEVTTRAKLHLQMEMSDVLFPRTVTKLERYRKAVEFVAARAEDQVAAVLASSAPESLIETPIERYSAYLAPWHRPSASLESVLKDSLAKIFVDGTPAEFARMMNEVRWQKINPAETAMAVFEELSAEKRALLFASSGLPQVLEGGLNYLLKAGVSQSDFRILASPELQAIANGTAGASPAPLTSVISANGVESAVLPAPVRALANSIRGLIREGEWQAVETLFTSNAAFYRALGLKNQIAAVSAMQPKIAREKNLAITVLFEVRDGLLKRFWADMQSLLTDEEMQQFTRRIRFEDFK